MTGYTNPYTAAAAQPSERAEFIRNTYLHVAAAVLLLIASQAVIQQTALAETLSRTMMGGRWSWLIVLGIFMFVSSIANKWAHSGTSRGTQYAGLIVYTLAMSLLMVPLLNRALDFGENVILQAGLITGGLFAGLTAVVFTTKKDFSFLGSIITIGGFLAMGFIVAGIIFQFDLGLFFMFAMVLLLSASILYTTSAVMRDYNTTQYVAASLALFSSIATLFWYVLQIVMSMNSD